MWGIIIGMISGGLMSVQGVFNTEVTKQTSVWVAASFVQVTALIVCIGAWFFTGRDGSFLSVIKVSPKYLLLGGAMGAFITYTVIQSMDKIGPARSVMFIVAAQLVVAYVIELFGMFGVEKQPIEIRKILGLLIMIGGIITFKWK